MTTIEETTFRINEPENIRVPKLTRLKDHLVAAEAVTLDPTIVALAALNDTAGIVVQTGADTFTRRTLQAPAAGLTITNPAGTAGDPTFVLANDLAAIEGLGTSGFSARTGADTWAIRSLTAPAAGLTITNPAGTAGNPTFALANDLAALEGLGSTGIAVRTAANTWAQRTIAGTANEITATNGNGVSGNPTLSLPAALTFTGKTITGGTYASAALNGTLGATTPSPALVTTLGASGLITATGGQIAFPSTQVPSANANTLDDYEEGTWTPALLINNSATGITYVANGQVGRYVKIGQLVYATGAMVLTSKGASVGSATISGLPFAALTSFNIFPTVNISFYTGMAAIGNFMGEVNSGTTVIALYNGSATTTASLADTNLSNTSQLYFSAVYQAAD